MNVIGTMYNKMFYASSHYAECRYADKLSIVIATVILFKVITLMAIMQSFYMLIVIVLSFIILIVIVAALLPSVSLLCVVILNVAAPFERIPNKARRDDISIHSSFLRRNWCCEHAADP